MRFITQLDTIRWNWYFGVAKLAGYAIQMGHPFYMPVPAEHVYITYTQGTQEILSVSLSVQNSVIYIHGEPMGILIDPTWSYDGAPNLIEIVVGHHISHVFDLDNNQYETTNQV